MTLPLLTNRLLQADLQGVPERQALDALGGYIYQIYLSTLAWLRLDNETQLYLEVAEDYALLLKQEVTAVQAKSSARRLSIRDQSVAATINSLIDLTQINPNHTVKIQYLTTAAFATNVADKDRVGGAAALIYWKDIVASATPDSGISELRQILLNLELTSATRKFINASDNETLFQNLLSRIQWQADQPSLYDIEQQLHHELIVVGETLQLRPSEAENALPTILVMLIRTMLQPNKRVLTRAQLLQVLEQATHVSLPARQLEEQLAVMVAAKIEVHSKTATLSAWSEGLAAEIDIAGLDCQGQPLRLSEGLYVHRHLGETMLRRIDASRATKAEKNLPRLFIVSGDAGYGKSTILWWLHRRCYAMDKVHTLLLRASWLNEAQTGIQVMCADLARTCMEAWQRGQTPIIFIDTADLLLRSDDGTIALGAALDVLLRSNAIVVLSTRPKEASRLDRKRFPHHDYQLGLYSDDELSAALDTYANRHYRSSLNISAASHFLRIQQAVAQGRPVKDLCAIPLAMRMLFEIYAPESIPDEVNIFSLYCDYWRYRIESDQRSVQRSGVVKSDTVDNLARQTHWVAVLMLCEGSIELNVEQLKDQFSQRGLDGRVVDELIHRGILNFANDNVSFFHQTFFEHAAARALRGLLPQVGYLMLQERCKARPHDLFIKPVLQHALLLAERSSPTLLKQARTCFKELLSSRDVADLSLALYAHCHCSGKLTDHSLVHRRVISSDAGDVLRIDFLRFSSNLPQQRLPELLPTLPLLWETGGLRLRKHLVNLLARLAYRLPLEVFKLTTDLSIFDYVFSAENEKDDLSVSFLELVGNLWLSQASIAPNAAVLLAQSLRIVLKKPLRFSSASQITAIIAKGDAAMIANVLDLCQPAHSGWAPAVRETAIETFTRDYCRLWALRWIKDERRFDELLTSGVGLDEPCLVFHLLSLSEWFNLQLKDSARDLVDLLPKIIDDIAAIIVQLGTPEQAMVWANYLLGPLLRTCQEWSSLRHHGIQVLQGFMQSGLTSWRTGSGKLQLGLATRLLARTEISPVWAAAVFAPPVNIEVDEWGGSNELRPFTLAAKLGGIATATQAYTQHRERLSRDKAFLSSMQSQVMTEFSRCRKLADPDLLLYMVSLSGDARKLSLVSTELALSADNRPQFREHLHTVISDMLRSKSHATRASVIQELPALIEANLYLLPTVDEAFALFFCESQPKPKVHLATWMSRDICTTSEHAIRLVLALDEHVSTQIAGLTPDLLFLKEQYLESLSTLIRRGLLNPEAALPAAKILSKASSIAKGLLAFTLAPPVNENHLRLFGWTLAATARRNAASAAELLKALLASNAAVGLGQGARRDLSRHMLPPLRDIFKNGHIGIWHDLLEFAATIDFRLARGIVFAALELRSSDLNGKLESMRNAFEFSDDLRKLISQFKHHHDRTSGSDAWPELFETLNSTDIY